jgi:hypothetical protein
VKPAHRGRLGGALGSGSDTPVRSTVRRLQLTYGDGGMSRRAVSNFDSAGAGCVSSTYRDVILSLDNRGMAFASLYGLSIGFD